MKEENSFSSEDSENDKFRQEARSYLRNHTKGILDSRQSDAKKSRQKHEEFKSNQINSGTSLISKDIIENPDEDVLSIKTEENNFFKRMTKDDLFKGWHILIIYLISLVLYSKNYEKEALINRYKNKK